MGLQVFAGGLMTILTPTVFLMTIIFILVLSKIEFQKQGRLFVILSLCLLILVFYVISGIYFISLSPEKLYAITTNTAIDYLLAVLNFVIGFWLFGFFRLLSKKLEKNNALIGAIIAIMWIVFSVASFSGTGPMIGTLMISQNESLTMFKKILPFVIFGLGLVIPFGLLTYFILQLSSRLFQSKWLKAFQIIFGVLLIAGTLAKLMLMH